VTRRWLLLLFFASGCAAWIYEIVWFYLVELIVGASAVSVALLLATFMGGMALGSALLPYIVSPDQSAARRGGTGSRHRHHRLTMPLVLPLVQDAYVAAAGARAGVWWRALVATLVLVPPTLLMGATLPAIARWTRATPAGAAMVGLIYTANIAGAATGTALAGFYLLRLYDTIVASIVAASLNFLVAAGAWLLARLPEEAMERDRHEAAPDLAGATAPTPRVRPAPCMPLHSSPASLRSEPKWSGRARCRCCSARASTPSR
jgi:spermidine synthase